MNRRNLVKALLTAPLVTIAMAAKLPGLRIKLTEPTRKFLESDFDEMLTDEGAVFEVALVIPGKPEFLTDTELVLWSLNYRFDHVVKSWENPKYEWHFRRKKEHPSLVHLIHKSMCRSHWWETETYLKSIRRGKSPEDISLLADEFLKVTKFYLKHRKKEELYNKRTFRTKRPV